MRKAVFVALAVLVSTPAWPFSERDLAKLNALRICEECDLSKADLRAKDLINSKLRGANLSGADLNHASLNGANLCGFCPKRTSSVSQ